MREKRNVVRYVVEIIILAVMAARLFTPLSQYFYSYGEMRMFTDKGVIAENGCSLAADGEYEGIFTYYPEYNLRRGAYRITIEYETDGTQNTCYLGTNSERGYNALRCEQILLSPNLSEMTFEAYLYEGMEAHVLTYYRDKTLTVKSVEIVRTHAMERTDLLVALLIITIVNALAYIQQKKVWENCTKEQRHAFLIVAASVVFCSIPLFTEGLMRGADLVFHLLRIEGIAKGLKAGMFPVKIQPGWLEGYGYAVSVFYGDALLYFPALLRIIGFPLDAAYKILIFAVHAATGFSAYYCIRKIVDNRYIASVGASLYLLSPYRMFGLFESRLGETIALIFVPLVAVGLYNIFTKDVKDKDFRTSYFVPMIGYVGLLNSHVLTTEIVAVFTLLSCLVGIRRVFCRERFLELVKTAAGALLISAAYIVPFLSYYTGTRFHVNTSQEGLLIQQYGMDLSQMVRMFPSVKSYVLTDGMVDACWVENAGVGVLILLGAFVFAAVERVRKEKYPKAVWVCFWFGILALFLSSRYFPWDFIRKSLIRFDLEFVIDSIQRPTRFMQAGTILLLIAGGCGAKVLLEKEKMWGTLLLVVCMCLTFVTAGYYADFITGIKEPETVLDIQKYAHRHTWSRGEYLPEDTDTSYLTSIGVAPGEHLEISDYEKKYLDITFHVKNSAMQESYADLPLVFYEGYVAKNSANSFMEVYNGNNNNVLRVNIPSGYEGDVHVYFKEPFLWRLSELMTFISTLVCMGYFIWRKGAEKHGKKCGTNQGEI